MTIQTFKKCSSQWNFIYQKNPEIKHFDKVITGDKQQYKGADRDPNFGPVDI